MIIRDQGSGVRGQRLRYIILVLVVCFLSIARLPAGQTVVVVTGAPGSAEFGEKFSAWAGQWSKACDQAGVDCVQIGSGTHDTSDRDLLKDYLSDPNHQQGQDALWLVLIGHGTFDGRAARFNLRGPDVTDRELGQWVLPVTRPLAVINTTACSSPFLKALSGAERVVVSATKSGFEINFAHFGGALAEAMVSLEADLDKDGQVSLLEAFLTASDQITAWYTSQGRLKTEHALIDDNADGLGTPADWFSGIRPAKQAAQGASLDGYRAHQFCLKPSDIEKQIPDDLRAKRNQLELQVMQLRDSKATLSDDEYYIQLETLLVQIAEIYEYID
ncbi:MAG: hypothetical protein K9N55_09580 [Phycisphaerae bacterium]|nr:hypothetical protein [Phycisphaerae bacterium]